MQLLQKYTFLSVSRIATDKPQTYFLQPGGIVGDRRVVAIGSHEVPQVSRNVIRGCARIDTGYL